MQKAYTVIEISVNVGVRVLHITLRKLDTMLFNVDIKYIYIYETTGHFICLVVKINSTSETMPIITFL